MQSENTLKIGIMGGSFDPIHLGHLKVAEMAAERFGLREIIFVTAYCPPHKSAGELAPAEHRFAMVELAVSNYPGFKTSRIEVSRQCPVHAGETIEDLKKNYEEGTKIYFITGLDAILTIINWEKARTYPGLSNFIAAARPGYRRDDVEGQIPEGYRPFIEILEETDLAISSTEIKSNVKTGKPIDGMVPAKVRDYIYEHKLYNK